jgi:hypothetical protein
MLGQFGIEEGRFRLDWVSASEADKFVETVHDMVKTVKALGPLHKIPILSSLEKKGKGSGAFKEMGHG